MILGIDASTAGSGGGKRHLIELLTCFDPEEHGFSKIKVWAGNDFLNLLPDSENIIKISPVLLNSTLTNRILWQLFFRDKELKDKCDIIFSPFGTYIGKLRPFVSMSRNMLMFQQTERRRFGISWMRLKLKLLYYIQKRSFKKSQGIILLSEHAREEIQKYFNLNQKKTAVIHHGVSNNFQDVPRTQCDIDFYDEEHPFRLLYVSTIWIYKHPWNVVAAVAKLKEKGYPVVLDLVGNIEQSSASKRLKQIIEDKDKTNKFIFWHTDVTLQQVSQFYKSSDLFVFASTCENMPNILLEAMSSGLPIASSFFPPMPEFLEDGGIYFDPTEIDEIIKILENLILNKKLREEISQKSFAKSFKYTWNNCADRTFGFLKEVYMEHKMIKKV